MPTLTPDQVATIADAAAVTYRAAEGDSNDSEIESLQEFRDYVLALLGIERAS